MSRKGRNREAFAALANLKRNPETWSPRVPVITMKAKKNHVFASLSGQRVESSTAASATPSAPCLKTSAIKKGGAE